MDERTRLLKLCLKGMQEKGLSDDVYKERLKKEIKAIDEQAEHEYFLSLYEKFSSEGLLFPENQHNNLVDYLLGLTNEFDINQESAFIQGESPDIDIDYIKEVRDYLKRDWAPQEFGRDCVCAIGTYGTSGIKMSILDMARVHGKDVHEIQSITSKLEDKDDEGKLLEWDKIFEIATFQVAGKSDPKDPNDKAKAIRDEMEKNIPIDWEKKYAEIKEWKLAKDGNLGSESVYINFANYCQENPEVAAAAKLGIARNRQTGVHAGGLIISNQPLDGFVPLEVRSVKKDNPYGDICSAWTEGLNAQDLQPVGLIKFDLLVINNLLQIAVACHLIKKRHNLDSICAVEGGWDWSDLSYLDDPKAIEMANRGDLKCIFQFDGDGMRKLVKRGGVTSFDDLPAYSSLYRPGPLNMGMDVKYCKRKKWSIDPEDPNGEPYSLHPVLESILGNTYGVMCIHKNTYVSMADGRELAIKYVKSGDLVHSVSSNREVQIKECHGCGPTKFEDGYLLTLSNGYCVTLTKDHKVLTFDGMKEVQDLDIESDVIACPEYLKCDSSEESIAEWLGDNKSVAYLLGQLVGDGCMTGSGTSISVGSKYFCDVLCEWFSKNIPSIKVNPYFHCRSWYLGISHSDLLNDENYGNRKTKFSKLLEDLNMNVISHHKRVPEIIMKSSSEVRLSFLAGLFDSDGHSPSQDDNTCHITSVSDDLLNDVRKLLSMEGILCSIKTSRLFIWNQILFSDVLSPYLVCKDLSFGSLNGETVGEIPRIVLRNLWKDSGLSQRAFSEKYNISRSTLRNKIQFCNTSTYKKVKDDLGDLRYYSIESIEVIPNQQFYAMSVADNHNLIANGIVVKNCYQEQVMEILRAVGKIPDMHTEKVRKAISKKKIDQFSKYKDQFIVNGQEVLGVNKEFVTDLWDQIESFAEYGFNKSHATAYSYISSRLLWLKAHYPLEFYTAILQCESDQERFQICKLDAKNHEVDVCPVNINKSKNNFWIEDEKIYFGFQNIKGIGEAVAKKIVENQPYSNFDDFLNRYGTDSNTLKPLISLGVFDELEPNHSREFLRRYHEFMKDAIAKRRQRKQRFESSMAKKKVELEEMLLTQVSKDDPEFEAMNQFTDEAQAIWEKRFSEIVLQVPYTYKGEKRTREVTFFKQLFNLSEKKKKSERGFHEKERLDDENPRTLENFMAPVKLDDEEIEILRNEMIVDGHRTYPMAESMFYGFQWNHILETSPDFNPDRTIDAFLEMVELQRDISAAPIQIVVKNVIARKSKKGTKFWSVEIEDANGVVKKINIWQDDYIRFEEELSKGNMLQLKVSPPSGGFNTFTLKSLGPKWKRKKIDKDQDDRVVPMLEAEKVVKNETDLSSFNFDQTDIEDLLN